MKTISLCIATLLTLLSGTAFSGVTVTEDEAVIFYAHDVLGSPIAVSDEQGRVLWYENTQPYGKSLNRYSPDGQGLMDNAAEQTLSRVGYTGHQSDTETGLIYMKARYYDPHVGRFYSNDPVGFKDNEPMLFSRYSYANNNSYIYVDPDGKEVLLQSHYVAPPINHAKITIIPDNQALYAQDPRFTNTLPLPDGRRFATIGAGPVDGKLVSGRDRKKDVSKTRDGKNTFSTPIQDSSGRTEDELIEDLFNAQADFNNDLDYDLIPEWQDSYNSNSFISGLMDFLNITSNDRADNSPGWDKPVPANNYVAP